MLIGNNDQNSYETISRLLSKIMKSNVIIIRFENFYSINIFFLKYLCKILNNIATV